MLQASRYVVNSRFRSDWAKQIGPECSWDVKLLSCVKKGHRAWKRLTGNGDWQDGRHQRGRRRAHQTFDLSLYCAYRMRW